ncbi:Stage II sporulation protein SA [Lentibacillus sp. JNUCC-1]|uniref:type II toxin-antitoxin system SpoIISA family toxin n=1 Tax=Lentibacillus sp. JNUCC-1 TaxID=2654513 RepID=UPI0012E85287|nr:type II toxin-antitoxin system SpoIISA family toxin [Lentibacillus sp. JNUCC-1]MUV38853.1 Stage II sporulation protein SA [Lentibacillus sp. JNUCC-1]
MAPYIIAGLWFLFVFLVIYTILAWKKEHLVENTDVIRRTWYLIFILGCLVYLTNHPYSLFEKWTSYLIVLVAFVIVDSLLFLNLYISKIGGHEMRMREKQVSETEELWNITNRKVDNMEFVLNAFEYPSYTRSKDEYVHELENSMNAYAGKEFLNVDVLPYRTSEERAAVLKGDTKGKIKRQLELRKAYYSSKDKYMLMPLQILDEEYVAKVTSISDEVNIHDVDTNILNMMLMVFTLAVDNNIHDKGGDEC